MSRVARKYINDRPEDAVFDLRRVPLDAQRHVVAKPRRHDRIEQLRQRAVGAHAPAIQPPEQHRRHDRKQREEIPAEVVFEDRQVPAHHAEDVHDRQQLALVNAEIRDRRDERHVFQLRRSSERSSSAPAPRTRRTDRCRPPGCVRSAARSQPALPRLRSSRDRRPALHGVCVRRLQPEPDDRHDQEHVWPEASASQGFISRRRRREQLRGHPPRADSDGACRAGDGDGGSRHRVDVGADAERIANALAFELRRELGPVDRKIAVRLVVRGDDDAGENPFGVHADENLDRDRRIRARAARSRSSRTSGRQPSADSARTPCSEVDPESFGENVAAGNSCLSCPCSLGSTAAAD